MWVEGAALSVYSRSLNGFCIKLFRCNVDEVP